MSSTRVVITGFGAVSPLGLTSDELFQSLCEGKCGIDKISVFDPAGFPCTLAGEVKDFKVRSYLPKSARKSAKLMCRDIELAVAAADEAIRSSGIVTKAIDPDNINVDPTRFAINLGAGYISCDLEELAPAISASAQGGEFDIKKWGREGIEQVTPLWLLKYLPNMLACHIGILHDMQGPSNSITCSESSALLAVHEAAEVIERRASDVALAGAAEAKVNPIIMLKQCLFGRSALGYDDKPDQSCRPFDSDAAGSVFGEGAGMVVLESLENAKKRNASIHAEIVGIGESSNISSQYLHLESEGKGIEIAIEKALEDAQITPDQIDLVIPHGTGIADDDLAEAKAIENALGSAVKNVPVLPTKSMVSNTGAAAGAIDLVVALCAMREGKIPAAKNFQNPASGCNLNIVKEPIEKKINYVLCTSYTYGGQTAALIIKKFDEAVS